MRSLQLFVIILTTAIFFSCAQKKSVIQGHENNPYYSRVDTATLKIANATWKAILPATLYSIAREKNTEIAFTGKYWKENPKGTYYCAVCGNKLFRSDAKFSSTCGWPSFFEPVRKNSIHYITDTSYNMKRTEVTCARCESHLGHILSCPEIG